MTTIEIINKYFTDNDGFENKFNPPATPEQIAVVEKYFGITLPADYKDFLLYTNGFEYRGYEFNNVETIPELTDGYCGEFFPWAVHIGGNGGGEMFVIDKRQSPYQFGILPYVADEEDFLPLGNTFEELIKRLHDDTIFDRL